MPSLLLGTLNILGFADGPLEEVGILDGVDECHEAHKVVDNISMYNLIFVTLYCYSESTSPAMMTANIDCNDIINGSLHDAPNNDNGNDCLVSVSSILV